MSPLDDELRRTLSARAATLAPSPDPLAGIEARVARIRRRRTAVAVSGAVAVVAAVALAVPGLVPDRDAAPDRVATTPTPSAASSHPAVLDPADPWPLFGDEMLLTTSFRDTLQREWTKGHPASTLTPLFVQRWEPSGQLEVAFVSTGSELRVGWATTSDTGYDILRDEVAKPDAAYQFALDGDEGVTRLYVVAAPDSRVEYAADGVTYRDITQTFVEHKDGVGTSTTTTRGGVGVTAVESAGARVRVKAADGSVVYEADARGSTVTSKPSNVLDWPSRGNSADMPALIDVQKAFALSQERPEDDREVQFRPLWVSRTSTGHGYALGQAWFAGETSAYSFGYVEGLGEVGYARAVTPKAAAVLAWAFQETGASAQQLVVVPRPGTGDVSYATSASAPYRSISNGRSDLEGVGITTRDPQAGDDRVRVLDGNGDLDHPLYERPVVDLLCLGRMGCG